MIDKLYISYKLSVSNFNERLFRVGAIDGLTGECEGHDMYPNISLSFGKFCNTFLGLPIDSICNKFRTIW